MGTRKAGKRRPPVITVESDTLAVEVDGEMTFPHTGESVTFRKKISPSDLLVVTRAAALDSLPEDQRVSELARFFYEDVCPALARNIRAWTWTDMYADKDGVALPAPSVEALRELDIETELQWLLDTWLDLTQSASEEEIEKNQQKPSSDT